jgi:hypothetical protein
VPYRTAENAEESFDVGRVNRRGLAFRASGILGLVGGVVLCFALFLVGPPLHLNLAGALCVPAGLVLMAASFAIARRESRSLRVVRRGAHWELCIDGENVALTFPVRSSFRREYARRTDLHEWRYVLGLLGANRVAVVFQETWIAKKEPYPQWPKGPVAIGLPTHEVEHGFLPEVRSWLDRIAEELRARRATSS